MRVKTGSPTTTRRLNNQVEFDLIYDIPRAPRYRGPPVRDLTDELGVRAPYDPGVCPAG